MIEIIDRLRKLLGGRRDLLDIILVLVSVSMTGSSCAAPEPPVTPTRLLIATGNQSRVFYPLGLELARIYRDRIPEVAASAESTTGSVFNVQALQEGHAELAFTQSDVAYFAYHHGSAGDPRPYHNLRAIAALYVSPIHIVVRRDGPIKNVADLRGRHIAVGAPTGGAEIASRVVLEAQNLGDKVSREPLNLENETARVRAGELDAGFVVASDPVPAITQLNSAVGIRLIEIDSDLADRIRTRYPFFRPFVIPDGMYEGQGGDVKTLGVENLLVCRADLPEQLVYRLTRLFIESLEALSLAHPAAASIDPEQAPATPIPLHPGAAWFYRERELFR